MTSKNQESVLHSFCNPFLFSSWGPVPFGPQRKGIDVQTSIAFFCQKLEWRSYGLRFNMCSIACWDPTTGAGLVLWFLVKGLPSVANKRNQYWPYSSLSKDYTRSFSHLKSVTNFFLFPFPGPDSRREGRKGPGKGNGKKRLVQTLIGHCIFNIQ